MKIFNKCNFVQSLLDNFFDYRSTEFAAKHVPSKNYSYFVLSEHPKEAKTFRALGTQRRKSLPTLTAFFIAHLHCLHQRLLTFDFVFRRLFLFICFTPSACNYDREREHVKKT